jgi:hypothetical protein
MIRAANLTTERRTSMIDASIRYLIAGLLLTLPASSRTKREPHSEAKGCTVTIYLSAKTAMPAGMLFASRTQAIEIFREAGVNVRVLNGTPPMNPYNSCGAPIVLEIDATAMRPVSPSTLAYAMPYKKSGTCIYVLFDRVVDRSWRPSSRTVLLAYVMVHEISHVLQQVSHHSESGIMKAHWSGEDYERMEFHSLPFTPEDIDLIRTGLARQASGN